MVADPAPGLPSPPSHLNRRKLPLKLLRGPLFRIHLSLQPCLYFGRSVRERFDDPLGKFGVMYAALQPEGAFAEVFLRRLSFMLIRELDLQERSLSQIVCDPLHCVNLTGAGLRRISCDNRISAEQPYDTVGQWSRALFAHPQKPDGILYRSRLNPRFICVALFDRCQHQLRLEATQPLMSGPRRTWTIAQVDRYKLAIEPAL